MSEYYCQDFSSPYWHGFRAIKAQSANEAVKFYVEDVVNEIRNNDENFSAWQHRFQEKSLSDGNKVVAINFQAVKNNRSEYRSEGFVKASKDADLVTYRVEIDSFQVFEKDAPFIGQFEPDC